MCIRDSYEKALESALDLASTLRDVETSEEEASEERENVFQDQDLRTLGLTQKELLQNAPAEQDGCFFVPEVLE